MDSGRTGVAIIADQTEIAWTDSTFNPWWGCTKVGPGCDHCYAEALDKRTGGDHWGLHSAPRIMSDENWKKPIRWNKKTIEPRKVFCGSMCDVFDNNAPAGQRERLWELIRQTPNLQWQLLTKRVGNIKKYLPEDWGNGYPNVWLGITVVNQEEADRDIPKLLQIPARVRFLSMEPLLEAINLSHMDVESGGCKEWCQINCLTGNHTDMGRPCPSVPSINWVIVGGESGHHARPFVLGWAKDIVRQCKAAGVPVFVKQVGANPTNREGEQCPHIRDRKGGNMNEWPEILQAREFPII